MNRFIALLRGVNVGGKTVKMERLRVCFEALGLSAVQTYIQSGNVLFETDAASPDALRAILEEALRAEFGFEITVILLTADELAALRAANPYTGRNLAEGERVHVTILECAPVPQALQALQSDPKSADEFVVQGRAIWILCRSGYGRTAYTNAWFEKKLKLKATTRNLETMTTLCGLWRE